MWKEVAFSPWPGGGREGEELFQQPEVAGALLERTPNFATEARQSLLWQQKAPGVRTALRTGDPRAATSRCAVRVASERGEQ